MNIIFFGSSDFSVPSLEALLSSQHRVLCVVTQPDAKKGRGLKQAETAVKKVAENLNIRIYQPECVNSTEAVKFFKTLNPDLFVVIAYGQILSEEILKIPKIFAMNIHASVLPKYRGAAPVNWALINGEKTTGISLIKMTSKMDAGPLILQKGIEIDPQDDAFSLENKLSILGAEALVFALEVIGHYEYSLKEQDKSGVSFAPKLKKEDGRIEWAKTAVDIHNLIRGCAGWPGAFTYYKDKLLKIYKGKVATSERCNITMPPGEIIKVSQSGIVVATAKDEYVVQELQIEGKRKMSSQEFILGHKISVGEKFVKNLLHKNGIML